MAKKTPKDADEALSSQYPHLVSDVLNAPKTTFNRKGGYVFHIFSIGERGSWLSPQIVEEALTGLTDKVSPYLGKFDYIVSVEPGGNPWALLLAHHLKVPLAVVRERKTGLGEEFRFEQNTPVYNKRWLYFRGLPKTYGNRVIIVDDVFSTGHTSSLLTQELIKLDKTVIGIFTIIVKGDSYIKTQKTLGVPIHSVLKRTDDNQIQAGP